MVQRRSQGPTSGCQIFLVSSVRTSDSIESHSHHFKVGFILQRAKMDALCISGLSSIALFYQFKVSPSLNLLDKCRNL